MMRSVRHPRIRAFLGLAASVILAARMVVSPWFHDCAMAPPVEASVSQEHHTHHAVQDDAGGGTGEHHTRHDCRCAASQCGPGGAPAHRPSIGEDFGASAVEVDEEARTDLRLVRPAYQLPYATAPPVPL